MRPRYTEKLGERSRKGARLGHWWRMLTGRVGAFSILGGCAGAQLQDLCPYRVPSQLLPYRLVPSAVYSNKPSLSASCVTCSARLITESHSRGCQNRCYGWCWNEIAATKRFGILQLKPCRTDKDIRAACGCHACSQHAICISFSLATFSALHAYHGRYSRL